MCAPGPVARKSADFLARTLCVRTLIAIVTFLPARAGASHWLERQCGICLPCGMYRMVRGSRFALGSPHSRELALLSALEFVDA